jgi:hypothetical protein
MASAAVILNAIFFVGSGTIAVKFLVVMVVTYILVEEDVVLIWKLDVAIFDGEEHTHDIANIPRHGTAGAVQKRPIMELLGPVRKLRREHEVVV